MANTARSARLLRWCGLALAVAGVLMAVATLLHPSHETATTIIASEVRLVAAHTTYTLSWMLVLLGLPGLYTAQRGGMGRLGFVGFVIAFLGTYLIAVSGNFGFLAPVLAKDAPAVIDAISQYPPVVGLNAVAAIGFMVGYILFGIAMIRTAGLPRLSGILVAVGAPAHLIGFGARSAGHTRPVADRHRRRREPGRRPRLARLSAVAGFGSSTSATGPQDQMSVNTDSSGTCGTLTQRQDGGPGPTSRAP